MAATKIVPRSAKSPQPTTERSARYDLEDVVGQLTRIDTHAYLIREMMSGNLAHLYDFTSKDCRNAFDWLLSDSITAIEAATAEALKMAAQIKARARGKVGA